jgi:hypothetical protein
MRLDEKYALTIALCGDLDGIFVISIYAYDVN